MGVRAHVIDMDGTLVNVDGIVHLLDADSGRDFAAFHAASANCPPNQQAIDYCRRVVEAGDELVIVTARAYRWQALSENWLRRHLPVDYAMILMRGDRDFRRDDEVKRDIHRSLVDDHGYDIVGAIDDRPQVIDLWRELGIPVEVVPRADWNKQPHSTIRQPNEIGASQ